MGIKKCMAEISDLMEGVDEDGSGVQRPGCPIKLADYAGAGLLFNSIDLEHVFVALTQCALLLLFQSHSFAGRGAVFR